ncbi:MAG: hypothetical protein JL50_19430 [Peptococcaceae bacterium BICA1-7]|nr:MAG: hypothetical protein JL50_19430 [Peptococcaceae bacterium BICA1-7]HBV96361.1 radical SAM/SPASM domain-containing protein [Desulfotomaculum sp.]
MKASRYNFFAQKSDGKIAFNAFSAALGLFSEQTCNLYERVVSTGDKNLSEREKVVLEELVKAHFIVPKDFDELKALQVRMNRRRYDSSLLGLTIMPTAACNLRCRYCYEKTSEKKMSPETIDALVGFVKDSISTAKRFDVTWYGGEPLLEKKTIYDLSSRFLEACQELNCYYSAGIITNGVLLDGETARRLATECSINFCQVTLDGPRSVHNARRPFKDGSGTYDAILKNLQEASRYLRINIRINIDSENEVNYLELLDDLELYNLKDKADIHIGMVEPVGFARVCADTTSKCLDDEKMAEYQRHFYSTATQRGFSAQFYLVPANVFGLCAAEIDNSFVVEPDGSLHKCWVTVGDEKERVGNIRTGVPQSTQLLKWVSFDPTIYEECRECRVLPLCFGNCVYRAQESVDGLHCGMWKYKLEKVLESIEEFQGPLEKYIDEVRSVGTDIRWVYEGVNSRKRCCTIVCVRCTSLGGVECTFGQCKPLKVGGKK